MPSALAMAVRIGLVRCVAGGTDFARSSAGRGGAPRPAPESSVPILATLALVAPFQWHHRIVFDRAQGTLRLVRVTLFGTSVRREERLASIRGAKVTGSRGAFWQLVIELDSGETWAPPSASMRTDVYQPDQLQTIADQINQFLEASKQGSREG